MRRIPIGARLDICKLFDEDLWPLSEIANKYGVSRQGIWKVLRKHGIDTSKRKYLVECNWCGKKFLRTKKVIRRKRQHFCCEDHWFSYVTELGKDYLPNRHGQRMGRAVVEQYFELKQRMVVHHDDKNCLNNAPWNLMVFENNSAHVSYHRGGDVIPLWDGTKAQFPIYPVLDDGAKEFPV